jgi:hypothetical protein
MTIIDRPCRVARGSGVLAIITLSTAIAAGCASGDRTDSAAAATTASAVTGCSAPTIIAPLSGQNVGGALRVRTRADSCLIATKCYLDSTAPEVASGGAGDLDAPISAGVGSHHVSCNGWDSSGNVYVSPNTPFTVVACGAPAILSPVPGEQVTSPVRIETSPPGCLHTTKCYLDNHAPEVITSNGPIDQTLAITSGSHVISCNGWDSTGTVHVSAGTSFTVSSSNPGSCTTTQPIASITGHNTSANAAYNQTNFAANFGTSTWISQQGATMSVDPTQTDLSLNPITPGHVSNTDIHAMVPSRPDLRWFAHATPWFGPSNHINIGITSNSDAYVGAMLTDMINRGFDGVVIDWYGQGGDVDQATRLIQSHLQGIPNNTFKYIIMMDKGIPNLSQSVLSQQIDYVRGQYFGDANYEKEGGKAILMFFGVEAAIGTTAMAAVKSSNGGDQVWVVEGTGGLSKTWVDQVFDWAHPYHDGPSSSDPYDLAALGSFYSGVSGSSKHAFGALAPGFNGMLTKSVSWSQGKYLPRGDGACIVQQAGQISSVIPANVTRMQVVTWSDWEEGSQVETGVENHAALTATVSGTTLSWTVSSGTGDESTIDHYEIYASPDGNNAFDLGSVAAGARSFDLAASCLGSGSYQVAVVAVGKAMIRDHASAWRPYTAP